MIGYRVVECGDRPWRYHHGALVPLFLPHVEPRLDSRQLRKEAVKARSLFVRWEEGFDRLPSGEWWHIVKDVEEDLSSLSKKSRWQVRQGSKFFQAMKVDRDVILSEGYAVYRRAFDRYSTFEACFPEKRFKQAIATLPPETEFWAVRDRADERMVAFSENLVRDNACFYSTMWFDPEALKRYVGYLLVHEMNKHYLNERRLKYVSDGARSISHQTNVHEFLQQKFGFRRAYARLRIVYAPGVGAAVKLLYPFRRLVAGRSATVLQKLAVLLEQERIRRACTLSGEET